MTSRLSMSTVGSELNHAQYLENVAKFQIPKRLNTLLQILELEGNQIVSPHAREGLNPFLIPLAKQPTRNNLLCYLRWPTQKVEMELQIVETNEVGVNLVSLSTDKLCLRKAIEADYYAKSYAQEVIDLVNKDGHMYKSGDYISFFSSLKNQPTTEEGRRLILDRFILTKVGAFPDCYERLAQEFLEKKNEVSALVTCERAVNVFYGWGHPITFHVNILQKIGRKEEARDTARSSLHAPKWTLTKSKAVSMNTIRIEIVIC